MEWKVCESKKKTVKKYVAVLILQRVIVEKFNF